MASESWSAFTLQATRSWAVDAATCLADEMSFSSLAWPCTEALAASHKLLVAAATIRACVAQKVRKTSVPPWALHDERFEVLHYTLFCLNCEEKHHCRRFVSFHQELKISLQYLSYCWYHYRLILCGCAKCCSSSGVTPGVYQGNRVRTGMIEGISNLHIFRNWIS